MDSIRATHKLGEPLEKLEEDSWESQRGSGWNWESGEKLMLEKVGAKGWPCNMAEAHQSYSLQNHVKGLQE